MSNTKKYNSAIFFQFFLRSSKQQQQQQQKQQKQQQKQQHSWEDGFESGYKFFPSNCCDVTISVEESSGIEQTQVWEGKIVLRDDKEWNYSGNLES